MITKRLPQYQGHLTPSQVADGINAASSNAKRLAEDAQLLVENGRFPTAASIAILAIEEYGKISILRGLSTSTTPEGVKDGWKRYRTHTKKNGMAIFIDLFLAGARKLREFKPAVETEQEHNYVFDNLKQLGFYSDCLNTGKWISPSDVVSETESKKIVTIATILTRSLRPVTTKEIELWIEIVGPSLSGSQSDAESALASWYTAMQENGLIAEGENQMSQFVTDGFPFPPMAQTAG